jgi:putative oxidoreductase
MSMSPSTTSSTQDVFALVGRILIAVLFIPAGVGKLMGFAGTAGYIASVGLPLPEVGAVLAIVIELGLGLMLLAGYKTRPVALGLAVFTVVAGVLFHNFWAMPADQVFVNKLMFLKNLSIAGGLLAFAAFGAGRLSVDGRTQA